MLKKNLRLMARFSSLIILNLRNFNNTKDEWAWRKNNINLPSLLPISIVPHS
jgi:hypothetical protein